MAVDSFRVRVRKMPTSEKWRDSGALCRCGGDGRTQHVLFNGGRDGNAPHRKGCKGCRHRADKVIDMALSKKKRRPSTYEKEPPF
jgi:hypothetical protein